MYNLEENKMYLENIGLHLRCNTEKVFIIHELFIFLKNCYFLKSAFLSSKYLVGSFEIHNLEGNQMYYKNISLHLAYLQTNEK